MNTKTGEIDAGIANPVNYFLKHILQDLSLSFFGMSTRSIKIWPHVTDLIRDGITPEASGIWEGFTVGVFSPSDHLHPLVDTSLCHILTPYFHKGYINVSPMNSLNKINWMYSPWYPARLHFRTITLHSVYKRHGWLLGCQQSKSLCGWHSHALYHVI